MGIYSIFIYRNDICHNLAHTVMCPRSHRQLWLLGEDCLYAKVTKSGKTIACYVEFRRFRWPFYLIIKQRWDMPR